MANVLSIFRAKRAGTAALPALFALLAGLPGFAQATSFWPFEVVSPNGGETYAVGDTLTVTVGSQSSTSLCVLSVNIGPYIFGFPGQATQFRPQSAPVHSFKIPAYFIESADTGKGPFLDSTSLVSDECVIQLADYSLPDNNDLSDSTFSIIAAPIVITAAPSGIHLAGDRVTVTWRAADRIPGCSVEFWTDGGRGYSIVSPDTITRHSAEWGNFSFVIPASAADKPGCMVKVRSIDGSYTGTASTVFSVAPAAAEKRGGCGSGFGLALIPALLLKIPTLRKRKHS
jgi:hypothetical protein